MKRVLFVDDEPMILASLQNLLRKHRHEWEMVFIDTGENALRMMESAPFDVIVADMRMPKMDGATLLKHVQATYPQVVRIVLSGHAEMDVALRSVSVAHQYLSKPCDSASLQAVVVRACCLQGLLDDATIRKEVGGIGKLPSAPKLYTAITSALASPNSSLKDVAKLVERDMAVSAKVLQLVNSAFFGLPKRVTSVMQAVSYLGDNLLRRVLLSVEAFAMFEGAKVSGFCIEELQAHALLVATVGSQLFTDKAKADDAFIAGVLHDVGKLVLALHAPAKLESATAYAKERGQELHAAEQDLHGITHAEVGAYLLGIWGLPYTVVEAVAHHHRPERAPHATFDVVDSVYVAEALIEQVSPRQSSEPTTVGKDYFEVIGISHKLDQWREMARAAATRSA